MTGAYDYTATVEERFWSKVQRGTPDECWPWMANRGTHGYGRVTISRKGYQAHRVAYEWLIGPIPDGLQLDHLCRNPACVNPKHLEPVTNRENLRRGEGFTGRRARQTHCIHGHEFTPENTSVKPNGCRSCKTCARYRSLGRTRLLAMPAVVISRVVSPA